MPFLDLCGKMFYMKLGEHSRARICVEAWLMSALRRVRYCPFTCQFDVLEESTGPRLPVGQQSKGRPGQLCRRPAPKVNVVRRHLLPTVYSTSPQVSNSACFCTRQTPVPPPILRQSSSLLLPDQKLQALQHPSSLLRDRRPNILGISLQTPAYTSALLLAPARHVRRNRSSGARLPQ